MTSEVVAHLVTGRQLIFLSVPVSDGYRGAGSRFAAGPIDPLSELRHVVRVPHREVVPAADPAAFGPQP